MLAEDIVNGAGLATNDLVQLLSIVKNKGINLSCRCFVRNAQALEGC